MKVYIISCDDNNIYKLFLNSIRNKIPNVRALDYDEIKYNIVSKMFNTILSPTNTNTTKMIDKVTTITDKFNDLTFKILLDKLSLNSKITFIRVNDKRIITKLKRTLKRNNYYTIRIINTSIVKNKTMSICKNTKVIIPSKLIKQLNNYKFDSKIYFIDTIKLNRDAIKFAINHISINHIKL